MGHIMQPKNAKANCLIKDPIGLHACSCACPPGLATAQKCNVPTFRRVAYPSQALEPKV